MSTIDTAHETAHERTHRSWMEMAIEGIDVCDYAPSMTFPGEPRLQQTIRLGREVKAQLDTHGPGRLLQLRSPLIATMQLRLYLGAIAGMLGGVHTLEEAQVIMGIRSDISTVKQEWR